MKERQNGYWNKCIRVGERACGAGSPDLKQKHSLWHLETFYIFLTQTWAQANTCLKKLRVWPHFFVVLMTFYHDRQKYAKVPAGDRMSGAVWNGPAQCLKVGRECKPFPSSSGASACLTARSLDNSISSKGKERLGRNGWFWVSNCFGPT